MICVCRLNLEEKARNIGGNQRSQSRILLALLALGNLLAPIWEFITMLLFKGPVRGAFCALSRQGFGALIGNFVLTLAFIFNAGSFTLSVDSTIFFFCSFYLYACIRSFYFSFNFSRRFVSYCYSFPCSNYILFITC